jgi:hypothetical protein
VSLGPRLAFVPAAGRHWRFAAKGGERFSVVEVQMFRPSHAVVGALALMAAACNDSTSNFVSNLATIRLANDTDTPISITVRGTLDTLNRRLTYGSLSTCLFVDLSTTTVPVVSVMNAVTGATIVFTPVLTPGENALVVAWGDTLGAVALTALDNRFVPVANEAGLRFFNGVPRDGSLSMQRNSATLTPFIGVGSASRFVSVPIDSGRITFSNAATVVLDAGLLAFPQGQNSTVVVGPPVAGSVLRRLFVAQGC